MTDAPCPYCAEPVSDGARRCASCGEVLVEREPAEPERPGFLVAFAVVNAVLGLLGVGGGGLTVVALVSVGAPALSIAMQSVSILVGGLLLASAVGLWLLAPWGRALSIGVSGLGAGLSLLGLAMTVLALARAGGSAQGELIIIVAITGSLNLLVVAYFGLQLALLLRSKTAAAFRR